MTADDTELKTLKDIISAINKIEYFLRGVRFEDFQNNQLLIDYTLRHFEMIREATEAASPTLQAQFPQLSWKKLATLQKSVTQADGKVDTTVLWKTITRTLPSQHKSLLRSLKTLRGDDGTDS